MKCIDCWAPLGDKMGLGYTPLIVDIDFETARRGLENCEHGFTWSKDGEYKCLLCRKDMRNGANAE